MAARWTPGQPVDAMCSPEGGRTGAEQIVADLQVAGSSARPARPRAYRLAGAERGGVHDDLAGQPHRRCLLPISKAMAGVHYYPGYFRVVTNDLYRGRAVADFAWNELGLQRMGAVHDGDPTRRLS